MINEKSFFVKHSFSSQSNFLPVYENIVKLTSNIWLGILNLKKQNTKKKISEE